MPDPLLRLVPAALAPGQADRHGRHLAFPRQDNIAGVTLVGDQSQFLLINPHRPSAPGRGDLRRLPANVGPFFHHLHRPRRADDFPGRRRQHGGLSAVLLPYRSGRGHRKIEFAVFQHLRPDAAIDAPAHVLDELSVNIRVDRCAGLRGVNRDFHRGGDRFLGARLGRRAQGQAEQRQFEQGKVELWLHRRMLCMYGSGGQGG